MINTYITEIANALNENHAALMVGSGFSKNADKIITTDKYFLDWNELSDKFYDSVYDNEQDANKEYIDPLRLAQEVETVLGRPKLEEMLKEAAPDVEYAPSGLYDKLMELPWRDIFTTNYDTLLERAAEKVTNRRYDVVVCQEDLVNSVGVPRIIKLHGSFPSQRPFIITEEDYRTYPTKYAAMVNTVQQALLENVFCMIGFSCEDPNFIKWIGWIHDNLGMVNSQRIYMISIAHIKQPKRDLLLKQNITVVDLEELYPGRNAKEKISQFLDDLKNIINAKEKERNWFDLGELEFDCNLPYVEKTKKLKKLNKSYPGWVVMPWKMKSKVNLVLQQMLSLDKIDKIPWYEALDYIYESVRFFDIVGRPILSQFVDKFWGILEKSDEKTLADYDLAEIEGKRQVIYLNLLRSYRELAEWEKYDQCHEKIHPELLSYDDKQLLFVCDWWSSLYRFQDVNLVRRLDEWKLTSDDVYWSMIKAGLYSVMGEIYKAEEILEEDLTIVRRKLTRAEKIEYLSSLEDCIVSLINYIRTASINSEREACVYESDVSWWNENEKYCLNLKAEETTNSQSVESTSSSSTNFDLSQTYTWRIGTSDQSVFHALEYLRFLEQTGHPFRIANVTNTDGLHSVINILSMYYPHWCLMQILIAQDKKILDSLFGRAKLSALTQEEVDEIADNYVEAIHTLLNNVKPENAFIAKSFYEQAAAVLPEILSRLCCKCSTQELDKILDTMLEICLSNSKRNFKGLKDVFKRLLQAYSIEEQGERFMKILKFPLDIDRLSDYLDPINYVDKPLVKYTIPPDIYEDVIFQMENRLQESNRERKESAKNRFIILAQVAKLNDNDLVYLCEFLENEGIPDDAVILYAIDPVKYSYKLNEIYNWTMSKMKQDSKQGIIAVGGDSYFDLIVNLKEMNILSVDLPDAFSIMKNLVCTNIPWAMEDPSSTTIKDRILQSFIIASEMLILKNKEKSILTNEEITSAREYLDTLANYLPNIDLIKALWSSIGVGNFLDEDSFLKSVWTCEELDIVFVTKFYDEIYLNDYNMSENTVLLESTNVLIKMVVSRLACDDVIGMQNTLLLCRALLKNVTFDKLELNILIIALSRLKKSTIIEKNDSEEVSRNKIKSRIEVCKIAQLLYDSGIQSEILNNLKDVTEDKNEFVEIREIEFQ